MSVLLFVFAWIIAGVLVTFIASCLEDKEVADLENSEVCVSIVAWPLIVVSVVAQLTADFINKTSRKIRNRK